MLSNRRSSCRQRFCLIVLVAMASGVVSAAQMQRPRAVITPTVETPRVAPGAEVRLALKVTLPANLHVQSDEPRDPLFIPTVLTVDAPKGVTVTRIMYPAAEELKQAGQKEPLVVFGHEFTIHVQTKLAPDTPAGPLLVPGSLRYQACDDRLCYPPTRAETKWSLQVTPARARK